MYIKKIKFLSLDLNLTNYFYLFANLFTRPKDFMVLTPKKTPATKAALFFIFNLSTGLIVSVVIQKILFKDSTSIFFEFSQLILIIPFLAFACFLLYMLLHFEARILGGRGSLNMGLIAISAASFPMIFLQVPYLGFLSLLLILFLIINNLRLVHGFGFLRSTIAVSCPVISFLIFLAIISFR